MDQIRLDYAKISKKLLGPREWIGTRYYIGQVQQTSAKGASLYRDQRRFVEGLRATDNRISVHFGRLETKRDRNAAADELRQYLHGLQTRIDRRVFQDLLQIAKRHQKTETMVEKAVDVMLAVDMVLMAQRDQLDTAYLLSADGDFTPAVEAAKGLGKQVFAASPGSGFKLQQAVNHFIRLEETWFSSSYST